MGLFKVDGTKVEAIDSIELNSNNTAACRVNQTSGEYAMDDITEAQLPIIELIEPFQSNGYLD